jgi:hypothetical protein
MSSGNGSKRKQRSGIRIDLPFVSFHAGEGGWGWYVTMNDDIDAYERARRRVRARLTFYRHVFTYLGIVIAIAFIDLITGGGISSFTAWVAGIGGAFLVWEFFNVFVFPQVWSPETEEKMIQDELRKQNR